MSVIRDDMLGQYDSASAAYKAGLKRGADLMQRAALHALESRAWQAEHGNDSETLKLLDRMLTSIRSINTDAAIEKI